MTRTHMSVAELTFKDRLVYALVISTLILASLIGFAGLARADEGGGGNEGENIKAIEAEDIEDINLGSGVSGNGEVAMPADINLGSGVSGNGEVAMPADINLGSGVSGNGEVAMPADINLGSGVSGNGEDFLAAHAVMMLDPLMLAEKPLLEVH
jgi:hypothetical protein